MEVSASVLPSGSFHDLDPDGVLNGDLDSGVADYLNQILCAQYPNVSGLIPPSQLYAFVREKQPRQKIAPEEFCVQIHIYPGHYLVSSQINGSVIVIDSLNHPSHLPAVMPQLKLLYTEEALKTLEYQVPQSQGATSLCGFFAVANAQYLLQNKCVPCRTNFIISEMRNHLRRCIIEGAVMPFPGGHSVCNKTVREKDTETVVKKESRTSERTNTLLSGYFQDQQEKSEWKRKLNTLLSDYFQDQKEKSEWKRKLTKRQKYQLKLQKQRFARQNKNINLSDDQKNIESKRQLLSKVDKQKRLEKDRNRKQQKRKTFTDTERERIRQQDRMQHSQRRKALGASEKEKVRELNRVQHSERRKALGDSEKERIRQLNRVQHSNRRNRLDTSEKQNICEKDMVQHRQRRNALGTSEKEKVRELNRVQHSERRKALGDSEKEKVRELNRVQHSQRRKALGDSEKEKVRELNRVQHSQRRKALGDSEKEKVRELNRVQHSERRKALRDSEKEKVRELNRVQHSERRKALGDSEKEKVRELNRVQHSERRKALGDSEKERIRQLNRVQHSNRRNRLDTSEKQNICEKDMVQHRQRRNALGASEKEKVRELNRVQHSERRKALSDSEKEKVRELNRVQHSQRRKALRDSEKEKVRELNRVQHSERRKALGDSEKEKLLAKDNLRKGRERSCKSQDDKHEDRNKNRISRKKRRESMTEQEKEIFREQDRVAKKQKRTCKNDKNCEISTLVIDSLQENTIQDMLQNFFKSISEGPTYICCCCNRFLYRSAVKRLSSKIRQNTDKIPGLTLNTVESEVTWICETCSSTILKQKIPSQAISNNLHIEPLPDQLKNLSSLEKQLISKIIPFMKIVSLPTGSQHGLKGQVVLVPVNLQKTAAALPRQTGESQIVALNLKRRLSDKYGSTRQYIRPNVVNGAIHCLKDTNSHYSDTLINIDWTEQSENADELLWKSTCLSETAENSDSSDDDIDQPTTEHTTESRKTDGTVKTESVPIIDSEDEVDYDNPLEVVQDITLKRSLNSTTCVYPEYGPSVPGNRVLNLAPGEGQTPVSLFYQKHWETLAFPTLFPTATGSFHEERPVSISPKKYVISKLLSKDPRFAESPEYTFQCLHWIESTAVSDSISMSLKKSRQSPVTVRQLQNPERLQTLFKDEELFTSFKKIRGTPQYWKEMQQNMLAKIRHYGTYTFFLTGSAADFHWPELIRIVAKQYGEHYSLDFIQNHMDKKTKRNWLARNPVTAARHIDFIFRKLWGNVILSGLHPIGQILNYDIRKEMQSRGTAHFHSAVHVQGAPLVDKDTDDEVVGFVDKYITCSLPSNNENLKELVLSRQTHHHTRSCKKKKGVNCRFHFPKPPSETTVVARHPEGEMAKVEIARARQVLTTVTETLEQTGTDVTLTELLNVAKVPEQVYSQAVKSSMKKTAIILKRTPAESYVNPYNPVLLTALRANMDIQYITDVWACVAYITSYMCKPERSMSDLMRNACKEANTVKDKLKSIGNIFLKSREVSQHEAVARLLGLPLRETNVPVAFVPTGYSHQRTRMLKPPQVLEKMSADDTDIYQPNIIDKYAARPDNLENVCLAEFAANYVTGARTALQEEMLDEIDNQEDDTSSRTIKLKNGLGKMTKRKKPIVLRDYPVSRERDAEKYFHRLLLLYMPWRQEEELNNEGTFEEKFSHVRDTIEKTIEQYEPFLDEVQVASTMVDTDNCDEEIWDNIAPQAEQCRDEEVVESPEFSLLDTDNLTSEQIEVDTDKADIAQAHYSLSSHQHIEPQNLYLSMVRSLNERQRRFHDHMFQWCRQMNLATSKEEEPEPFYIFLSGPAGVGKSHVIHTVYQTAIRTLRKAGNTPDSPTVLLTAPTGKAAINIGGTTLHTGFHLPVMRPGSRQSYTRPSPTNLNSMRATYCNLKILIIDEISMVSYKTFSHLDLTLQEIFENSKLFGGVSVMTVGDLLQLQPVGEKPVFRKGGHGYEALAPAPWDYFTLYELTDIIRQKGDPEFASLLSRIRIGKQTEADIETLQGLDNTKVSEDCVSVFFTNPLKDAYNNEQLMKLKSHVYTIKAIDTKKDLHTGRIPITVTTTNIHQTGGLAAEIKIAVNARYMQTKNTDIAAGLVNGATGTIKKIEIPSQKPLSGTLYVKFDDQNIGKQLKQTSKYKGLVPVKPVSSVFSVIENSVSVQVERTQFPGTLAWGITVHKAQGSTYTEMIADMTFSEKQKNTMPGQVYTMLSRAKSMDRLKLVAFKPNRISVNNAAVEEMEHLKTKSLVIEDTVTPQPAAEYLCVSYLNVRSLKKHHEDVICDQTLKNSHIICLSETKVTNCVKYQIKEMDCQSADTKHGLAIYYNSFLHATLIELPGEFGLMEVIAMNFELLTVIAVYVPPATSFQAVTTYFNQLLQYAKDSGGYFVILGDFNLSLGKCEVLEKKAADCGFQQLVRQPTHELGSVLDVAFTNYPAEGSSCINTPVYYTDHHIISLQLKQ